MRLIRWTLFIAAVALLIGLWSIDSGLTGSTEGIIAGLLVGIIFVLLVDGIHRLITARRFRNLPIPEDLQNEPILEQEVAVWLAEEGRQAGLLLLTAEALIFFHRPLSSDEDGLRIPLSGVEIVQPFNRYGVLPSGFSVIMEDGAVYRFLSDKRWEWQSVIKEQSNALESSGVA